MSRFHVLIVDDEMDSAEVVAMLLTPMQIETTVATQAKAAFDLLQANPSGFQAAIIDLAMPEMDGFALMQAVRAHAPTANLLLMAMTAYHTPELRSKALKAGFNGYFPKPLNARQFLSTIESLLNG